MCRAGLAAKPPVAYIFLAHGQQLRHCTGCLTCHKHSINIWTFLHRWRLFKLTYIHVHCSGGNTSETLLLQTSNRRCSVFCGALDSVMFNDVDWPSRKFTVFTCCKAFQLWFFSHSCAAADRTSVNVDGWRSLCATAELVSLPDKISPAYANRLTNIFPTKQPTLDSVNIFSKSSVVIVKTVYAQKFTQLRTLLLSVHSAHQSLVMNTVQYSSCYMILLISICY